MNLKRTLAGSATLVVALSLSACGSDDAPEAASVEDFCAVSKELDETDVDDNDSKAFADALNEAADKLEEVGTPEDIDEESRRGFEVIVDVFGDIDADTVDELTEVGGDDKKAAEALGVEVEDMKDLEKFTEYMSTTCGDSEGGDDSGSTEEE